MKAGVIAAFLAAFAVTVTLSPHPAWSSSDEGASLVVYVSARDGSDAWSGRLPAPNARGTDGPLASFEGARDAVRSIDRSNLRKIVVQFRDGSRTARTTRVPFEGQSPRLARAAFQPDGGTTAADVARDGVYRLPAQVTLGAADSGSARTEIVYQNFPGEHPTFSGGVRVQHWVNVSDNRWQVALPPGTQHFENLFYNGERRLRPRLNGYLGPYNRIAHTTVVSPSDPTWVPANCTASVSECFDRFTYNTADAAQSDPTLAPTVLDPSGWGNLAAAQGNLCQDRDRNPNLDGDIEVLVFEQFSTSKLRVSCVDRAARTIYMTGPTGVPGAGNAKEAGFITGNRIIVENVKNALSEPGQWFLDLSAGPPGTLTYLARPGEDPNEDEVIIPQLPQLVVGLGVQHVTLRGLTFEHDNYVIPPQGHVGAELEPDITSAVSFQNSSYILIDDVVIRHTAGGGLDFDTCFTDDVSPTWCKARTSSPTSAHAIVANSAFYDLGAHGIRISQNGTNGLNAYFDDNTSAHDFVVWNNVVEGYGRVTPGAFGIGQGVGHNNVYAHNEVYDGYHVAISISHGGNSNDLPIGMGNANNTFAFNRVYNLMQGIMNDGGALRIEAGNAAGTSGNNRIVNNVVHDTTDASIMDNSDVIPYLDHNGYGGHGIYLDNSTGAVLVENNLVYRVSDEAVYTPHGPAQPGQAIVVRNNILAYARRGMIGVNDPYQTETGPSWVPTHVFDVSRNIMYFDRDLSSSPRFLIDGNCRFPGETVTDPPQLLSYPAFQSFSGNLYWSTLAGTNFSGYVGGFAVQSVTFNGLQSLQDPCGPGSRGVSETRLSLDQWKSQLSEDTGSVVKDPNFARPYYPFDDFSLRFGPPIAGFIPFNAAEAGRIPGFLRPPPVAATFLTMTYDPNTDY